VHSVGIFFIVFGATLVHIGVALLVMRGLFARWRKMSIEKYVRDNSKDYGFLAGLTSEHQAQKATESFNNFDRASDAFAAFWMGLFWEAAMPIWILIRLINFLIVSKPPPSDPELRAQMAALQERIRELEADDREYREEHDGV